MAPTDLGFGANQFTVDATGGGLPMYEHGDYFDDKYNNLNGGSLLTNIGYIISGHTDKVTLVHSYIPPARTNPLPSPAPNIPAPARTQTPSPQP